MVELFSVKELRRMERGALECHKAKLCIALWDAAPTELAREPLREQIRRVNTILNERPLEVMNVGL